MTDRIRGILTGGIWGSITIIALGDIIAAGGITSGGVVLVAVMMAGATASTRAIWRLNALDDMPKAKRLGTHDPRIDTLLAMMSPEEQARFKQELREQVLGKGSVSRLSDDGELDPMTLEVLEALANQEAKS